MSEAERYRASVYAASPECAERQCRIVFWRDPRTVWWGYYQHGDNPEAVLRIDLISNQSDPAAYVRRQLREFAERMHRYEESGVIPGSP